MGYGMAIVRAVVGYAVIIVRSPGSFGDSSLCVARPFSLQGQGCFPDELVWEGSLRWVGYSVVRMWSRVSKVAPILSYRWV